MYILKYINKGKSGGKNNDENINKQQIFCKNNLRLTYLFFFLKL